MLVSDCIPEWSISSWEFCAISMPLVRYCRTSLIHKRTTPQILTIGPMSPLEPGLPRKPCIPCKSNGNTISLLRCGTNTPKAYKVLFSIEIITLSCWLFYTMPVTLERFFQPKLFNCQNSYWLKRTSCPFIPGSPHKPGLPSSPYTTRYKWQTR